ncbi:MAG: polysaccharide biosynthesis/export family protein [Gammaproteobacteria bacterium]|uniref:polysaccharide biosynthesis/export family protein n=1 Tax=unclassified Methylotuvimicrobium TaxID=2822412 RepID=UPI001E02AB97|nr:polysaccharide biosynthesis/export family protein [Gammaproteobacteria bacterium]
MQILKITARWFYGCCLLMAVSFGAIAQEREAYLIQPGDVLEIMVWKEEGLMREVLVRPDGGISFPLAGDIVAQGKSIEQIEQELEARLDAYISEPVVIVAAKQLLGYKIYVVGKVNQPGEFIINSPVDVMQALSKAGGMTPFASVNSIQILRRDPDGNQRAIRFHYGDVEDGDDLEQNIILQAGDVVVVP